MVKRGLGKGLEALLPEVTEVPGEGEVEVSRIEPNPFQPRREFREAELAELAASIREHGILQPLVL
ncbi:MAG: ParB N-terminal domain-containing protein, partial [Thermaerobacter sp.]|nr:ParB N-terminal domain-containing protein [Thermaerobacter sp.]